MTDDEEVKQKALQMLDSSGKIIPKLVVFDLDYTIWPFYCALQSENETVSLYPHVKGILYALKDRDIGAAVASESPTRDKARRFLTKLGIQSQFVTEEIFTDRTHKRRHFMNINSSTGISYSDMLFFDDDNDNIQTVKTMGVTSILIEDNNGMNLDAFQQGLTEFKQNHPQRVSSLVMN